MKTEKNSIGSLWVESIFYLSCSCVPLYYYRSDTVLSRKNYFFFANNNKVQHFLYSKKTTTKNRRSSILTQWFPNLSWGPPATTHFVCLPHRPHPFQVLQTLLMSWWVESGVLNEGDIQNMLWLGVPRTGLRTTVLTHCA